MALDELVASQVAATLEATSVAKLPGSAQIDSDAIAKRVQQCEAATAELTCTAALIARWGLPEHVPTLGLALTRVGDAQVSETSGTTHWLALRWLPLLLVHYGVGVSGVMGERYDLLAAMHRARTGKRDRYDESPFALGRGIARAVEYGLDAVLHELPDLRHSRSTGGSDYFLGFLQRTLPRCFDVGTELEAAFDRFEILDSMTLYLRDTEKKRVRPLRGKFRWKAAHHSASDPLTSLEAEARQEGAAWPPGRAGLAGGSAEKFLELTARFRGEYLRYGEF